MLINWIDVVIVLWCSYYIYLGFAQGFFVLLSHLLSIVSSLWLAVRFHTFVGGFFVEKIGIPSVWQDIVGYTSIAFVGEYLLSFLFQKMFSALPKRIRGSVYSKYLGAILSLANALVIICLLLLVVSSLPFSGALKKDIQTSFIAPVLLRLVQRFGVNVQSTINQVSQEAMKFLTVEPTSTERKDIPIPKDFHNYTVDLQSEVTMVNLVNAERKAQGLSELRIDERMREAAREKSRDMFQRRYFSHYDPDGKNASDRMESAGISYQTVGENLAYAPDVQIAHNGLMESQGHRENILERRYRRIGIGIIDGGMYGKMFTQLFAD